MTQHCFYDNKLYNINMEANVSSEEGPQVELLSISSNLNTVFKAFDFNPQEGVIAYACANVVCILD